MPGTVTGNLMVLPRCAFAASVVAAVIVATGCRDGGGLFAADQPLRSYEDLIGSRFIPARTDPPHAPVVQVLTLPTIPGGYAIWGSVGRDSTGHVWFGLSADGIPTPSAHLFEYAPETSAFADRGDVVGQLKRAGVYRPGEGQAKIHSRIVQGGDGFLYFASMDEAGEHGDGSSLPTWGGHLWRVRPGTAAWEHLAATREALIAVAGVGRWIYALGYFDHVLYQFDSSTKQIRSVHVGSRGGHISRNFFADEHGHAYVPRLAAGPGGTSPHATLVELDTSLHEIAETPLDHYSLDPNEDSHGIVGFQYLADHSIAFVTDRGGLYHVVPHDGAAASVEALGWFHPAGESYIASVFTDDGRAHLFGVSQRRWNNDARYEWLVYDLASRTSQALPFDGPRLNGELLPHAALYGSMVRDDRGRAYVAGTYLPASGSRPLLLQVQD